MMYRCRSCWCTAVNSRKGAFMWRGKWEWAGREKLKHDEQAGKGGVQNSEERHTYCPWCCPSHRRELLPMVSPIAPPCAAAHRVTHRAAMRCCLSCRLSRRCVLLPVVLSVCRTAVRCCPSCRPSFHCTPLPSCCLTVRCCPLRHLSCCGALLVLGCPCGVKEASTGLWSLHTEPGESKTRVSVTDHWCVMLCCC